MAYSTHFNFLNYNYIILFLLNLFFITEKKQKKKLGVAGMQHRVNGVGLNTGNTGNTVYRGNPNAHHLKKSGWKQIK